MSHLFKSKAHQGVTMSRYGAVIRRDGSEADVALRDRVWREAREAGWTLKKSDDRDEGLVWTPPEGSK